MQLTGFSVIYVVVVRGIVYVWPLQQNQLISNIFIIEEKFHFVYLIFIILFIHLHIHDTKINDHASIVGWG